VFDLEVFDHLTGLIDNDNGVLFAGPIHGGKRPVLLPLLGVIHGLLAGFGFCAALPCHPPS
jgi:hypothetical protein